MVIRNSATRLVSGVFSKLARESVGVSDYKKMVDPMVEGRAGVEAKVSVSGRRQGRLTLKMYFPSFLRTFVSGFPRVGIL